MDKLGQESTCFFLKWERFERQLVGSHMQPYKATNAILGKFCLTLPTDVALN